MLTLKNLTAAKTISTLPEFSAVPSYKSYGAELARDLKRCAYSEYYKLQDGNFLIAVELVFKGAAGTNRFVKLYTIEEGQAQDVSNRMTGAKNYKTNSVGFAKGQWNTGNWKHNLTMAEILKYYLSIEWTPAEATETQAFYQGIQDWINDERV